MEGDDALSQNEAGFPKFWFRVQDYLKGLGLFLLEMRIAGTFQAEDGDELPVLHPLLPIPYEGYCLLTGYVSHGGRRHTIVGRHQGHSFKSEFDPHPAKPGIIGIEAVSFLVPLDPMKYFRLGRNMTKIERLTSGNMNLETWSAVAALAREGLGKQVIVTSGNVNNIRLVK